MAYCREKTLLLYLYSARTDCDNTGNNAGFPVTNDVGSVKKINGAKSLKVGRVIRLDAEMLMDDFSVIS